MKTKLTVVTDPKKKWTWIDEEAFVLFLSADFHDCTKHVWRRRDNPFRIILRGHHTVEDVRKMNGGLHEHIQVRHLEGMQNGDLPFFPR